MLQIVRKTILSKLSLDRISRSACTSSVRVSALDHEAAYNSVEDETIIESLLRKLNEIVYCVRSYLRIKFELYHIPIFHC